MTKFTFTVLLLLFPAIQVAAYASKFDPGLNGRVNMNGAIISSACDIDTGDGYQAIAMPSETRTHIKRTGEGDPQNFTIRLTNCSLNSLDESAAWQYINIIFDGDEDQGMFRVKGNANGVALELQDRNGTVIRPGKTMPWQPQWVTDNRLDYRIKLKNTMRDLVVGDYSTIIRYRIEYF